MPQVSPAQIAFLRDAQKNVFERRLAEQEALEHYGFLFRRENIPNLTESDVQGFLQYEFNRRWKNLASPHVTRDMDRLREGLLMLLLEVRPLAERLNTLVPKSGPLYVPYLGPAHLSAILLVAHPKRYGSWNEYSEKALTMMGLMPEFPAGAGFGDKYERFNEVLVGLARDNNVSLWRLDELLETLVRKVARARRA